MLTHPLHMFIQVMYPANKFPMHNPQASPRFYLPRKLSLILYQDARGSTSQYKAGKYFKAFSACFNLIFLDKASLSSQGWLTLIVILPPSSKGWDHRHTLLLFTLLLSLCPPLTSFIYLWHWELNPRPFHMPTSIWPLSYTLPKSKHQIFGYLHRIYQ